MKLPSRRCAPQAIDVFAGCGGLSIGLRRAGFSVIGAIEIDRAATQTYALNHPETSLWECDISTLDSAKIKSRLKLRRGDLDLLAGCPPCQGFSLLRTLKRKRGVRDARNDLVFEFERMVVELYPKTVMMENVPGLATNSRFNRLLRTLRDLQYVVNWQILDAADFGVPQRRKRLILLASRIGPINFAAPENRRLTVRDAIGKLGPAGKSRDRLHDMPEKREKHVQGIISRIPKDGGSRSQLPKSRALPCHKRCDGFRDVYGRMAWGDVAPTITTGCFNPSKGRFLHPSENRNITLREAALLQSFPRSFRFPRELGKQAIAKLIGNALPPEFVRRHARMLFEQLRPPHQHP